MTAVTLAKGVVEEPGEDVLLFVHAAQTFEKLLLGLALDDEICAGNKQLRWHLDRLCIRHYAVGGFIQAKQHVYRNRPTD
ncbi:hypothetical protein D3C84_899660 [compost metagenome]